jgi:hypothetical protein
MSHELRFQVEILPDLEWPALLERFQHVEALGFDLVGTGDQFVDSMNPSRPWFDLWALCSPGWRRRRIASGLRLAWRRFRCGTRPLSPVRS